MVYYFIYYQHRMEKLNIILEVIDEKICEEIDILVRRDFTCCKSCGTIKIVKESGYHEFIGYMFYPINQSIKWKKQIDNKELEYLEVEWYWNVTDEENDFIKLCKIICETINKITKHVSISGKDPSEPLVMKINKCLFMSS